MTAQHTPGPWVACYRGLTVGGYYVETVAPSPSDPEDGEFIADVPHRGADAYLIAAAPDMLKALRQVRDALGKFPGGRFIPEVLSGLSAIDAVIAKAEGRS